MKKYLLIIATVVYACQVYRAEQLDTNEYKIINALAIYKYIFNKVDQAFNEMNKYFQENLQQFDKVYNEIIKKNSIQEYEMSTDEKIKDFLSLSKNVNITIAKLKCDNEKTKILREFIIRNNITANKARELVSEKNPKLKSKLLVTKFLVGNRMSVWKDRISQCLTAKKNEALLVECLLSQTDEAKKDMKWLIAETKDVMTDIGESVEFNMCSLEDNLGDINYKRDTAILQDYKECVQKHLDERQN